MQLDTVDTVIGDNLRTRRIELGITQAELGRRSSISSQQISKYELGEDHMTVRRLLQFSKVLKCSIYLLIEGAKQHVKAAGR